ncbi:MAG: hypothetical protein ACOX4F_08105 [Atopobiaceae bacterium]|jgi:glyoxylase-like metal-dependent hydrolase (beta-lactamase superfamily II)
MKKTYVVMLPDHAGELLRVMKVCDRENVRVSRASHNAVIDPHTYFLDVEGSSDALAACDKHFEEMGILDSGAIRGEVCLLECSAVDTTTTLRQLLELIERYQFNITYCDMGDNEQKDPKVYVGIYVENHAQLTRFMADAEEICTVRILPYNKHQHVIDNTFFYLTFVDALAEKLSLDPHDRHTILVNSNKIIQKLEKRSGNPFKPFEYLELLAHYIKSYKGDAFFKTVRITQFDAGKGLKCTCIEPPAGSDTWVFECADRLFCIDSGYRAFRDEYQKLYQKLYPDWDERTKELFLTHADIDHAGCTDLFDNVIAVNDVLSNFAMERHGEPNWRAHNELHGAYEEICKILTSYEVPAYETFENLGQGAFAGDETISRCYSADGEPVYLRRAPLNFEVWQGRGGHVMGETILIERTYHLCISGDIFVNVHGETKQQARFDTLSPYLMISVDMQPDLCRKERKDLFALLDPGEWIILGGHGAPYHYTSKALMSPRDAR